MSARVCSQTLEAWANRSMRSTSDPGRHREKILRRQMKSISRRLVNTGLDAFPNPRGETTAFPVIS